MAATAKSSSSSDPDAGDTKSDKPIREVGIWPEGASSFSGPCGEPHFADEDVLEDGTQVLDCSQCTPILAGLNWQIAKVQE